MNIFSLRADCFGYLSGSAKRATAAFTALFLAVSPALATVTIEVCFSDGNLQNGSVGILVADVNDNMFLPLTDSSVIGTVLQEGENIGTSDDVIVAVFQADDGAHWSGGAGILATIAALDYADLGLAEGTDLILYTFPDITSMGASIAPGDVVNTYRNTAAGGSGGDVGFSCPSDPGVYTLAALTSALGGDFDPLNPSGTEEVAELNAGLPGGGGSDPSGNTRSDADGLTPGTGQTGGLTSGDIDYYKVTVAGLSQVIAYTTGELDTVGYLYAPDGSSANDSSADDDAGTDLNFRSASIIAEAGDVVLGIVGKAPNNDGSYEVFMEVVPLADYQTDLTIGKTAGAQLGDGLYSPSGAGQRVTVKLKKVKKSRLYFTSQNDGGFADDISLRGTKGNKKFRVAYFQTTGNFGNVTGAVVTGTYSENFSPLERHAFRVDSKGKSKVRKRGRGTLNLALTASSVNGGTDVGRGKVKVKVKKKR